MLKPLPMKHARIQILSEDLHSAALILAELGIFDPDHRPLLQDRLPSVPGARFRDLYREASSRLDKILRLVPLRPGGPVRSKEVVTEDELDRLNQWLGDLWARGSESEEDLRRLQIEDRLIDQLLLSLDNFANLDIDLGLLHGDKRFLDLRIGVIPRENVHQLREAIGIAGFLLYVFSYADGNAHIIVIGPKIENTDQLRTVLDTAGFHELQIPAELRDQPELARLELQKRRKKIAEDRRLRLHELSDWGKTVAGRLDEARHTLDRAAPFVRLNSAARSAGHLSVIQGWVPADAVPILQQTLKSRIDNPFILQTRDPLPEERGDVPSLSRSPRLLKSFAALVKTYGIPRYGEVDPTLLFTVTFVAMFGMMFGDIGHGGVIVLVALLARRKLGRFTVFVLAAGSASMVFGVLYGSIFGYEQILEPVWIAPLSDPVYMLMVALAWGIAFIVVVSILSVRNRLVEGDLQGAIFGNNGIVSLVLYLSLLAGIYRFFTTGSFDSIPAASLGLCLAVLFAFKLSKDSSRPGERVLVAIVETLETLTAYLSNTLSFLRVSAFSLNHVALSVAVFALADSLSTAGHVLMVIFGNVFILVLEGAIVTIQTLRLEYYEGFSRFFSGDGKEFRPLRLDPNPVD